MQRKLSKNKNYESKNREKLRLELARIHNYIANQRKDFLHKLTTNIINDNQIILLEDLAVKNMIKNHCLAKSISDASWGELVRQLTYKAEWYGRDIVKIDRYYASSKTCSNCGNIYKELTLSVREWECEVCHTKHDRDINAAKNILAEGLRLRTMSGVGTALDEKQKVVERFCSRETL